MGPLLFTYFSIFLVFSHVVCAVGRYDISFGEVSFDKDKAMILAQECNNEYTITLGMILTRRARNFQS